MAEKDRADALRQDDAPEGPPGPGASPLTGSAAFSEALYFDWKRDPESVPERWRWFFEGLDLSMCRQDCVATRRANAWFRIANLIDAYRRHGHRLAAVDPLRDPPPTHPGLTLQAHGFSESDLTERYETGDLAGPRRATLAEILAILQETYCRSLGLEYMHIEDPAVRSWLQRQVEPVRSRPRYPRQQKIAILELLIDAELFETFLHTRFLGQKRFSLEGTESLVPALHAIVDLGPELGVEEIVLGMAHRGRLNVLANILDKSYGEIFAEFESSTLPGTPWGDADVKYHKGYSSDHVNRWGRNVHISLTANPSHLEAVDPVVQGKARAKQRQRGDVEHRRSVLPVLVHGDAAFTGQGIVAETFNLSQLPGYRTGGTVHLVVNNQIGFTTLPEEARSSRYATDMAKIVEAPILHVNGEDPERVSFACELALRFRQEFGRDIVVDIVGFRRHGHNEADEPAFTQPLMVRRIEKRPSVRKLYTRRLIEEGLLEPTQESRIAAHLQDRLQAVFEQVRQAPPEAKHARDLPFQGIWAPFDHPYDTAPVDTSVPYEALREVTDALTRPPEGFHLHRKIARQLERRRAAVQERRELDWAFAELLAFGTLIREGCPVRLSGQDSARGTFSQRHAVWFDTETQVPHIPLAHVAPQRATFCVYNSTLSEAAVLGFDYGYSLAEPRMLILWEAQFGDFANGAQVIIDQFILAAEKKWNRASGLVMLLPHGYEGQGPEHSSAYLERYLAGCAEDNIQVCNATTPAQYFHLLRRQVRRPFRRPLVIMTPKSLLRHRRCISPVSAFEQGAFQEVLPDPDPPAEPDRILLCSGRIFYDLLEARKDLPEAAGALLVRLEQLHPWPEAPLREALASVSEHLPVWWVQEEPANRGAWRYVEPRLRALLGRDIPYVGRPPSASAATGSLRRHRREQQELVQRALGDGSPSP